tara:strand:+ start:56 stop:934 length:879 start_codon:yes stop_codon:yes gene_type:complete
LPDKLNILVAYPYFDKKTYSYLMEKDPSSFRLIVDSGAFTAWNTGAEVTMEGYTKFLKKMPSHWDWKAVQLDVYGDPKATYENWLRMLDMGWDEIMPVFTRGDTLDRLEEFYAASDYIMFGGIAFGGENKNYIKFFSEANKGRKVHWLGFTSMPFIKHYKPESVDSSSVTSAQRYGSIAYYRGKGMLKVLDKKKDFATRPPLEFLKACEDRGFTMKELKQLGQSEAWVGNVRIPGGPTLNGFASFVSYTHHVWRGIDVERNLGTKMYLAFAMESAVAGAFDAYDFMKSRGAV